MVGMVGVKVGSLWQSKVIRSDFVVVYETDGESVSFCFTTVDGNNEIYTSDSMNVSDFLEMYTPQRNRYFLVSWCYSNKKGVLTHGHKIFLTYDGSYLNYNTFLAIMKKSHNDVKDGVVVKSITELSEQDYLDFIS